MIDRITKNSKVMGLVSILTLIIVAYVFVYKPWKEKQQLAA